MQFLKSFNTEFVRRAWLESNPMSRKQKTISCAHFQGTSIRAPLVCSPINPIRKGA